MVLYCEGSTVKDRAWRQQQLQGEARPAPELSTE